MNNEFSNQLDGLRVVPIELAFEPLKESGNHDQKSIREILSTPTHQLEITIIDAGHMAYDHLFIRDGDNQLFVKAHDASRFTDALRESHSRAYLKKEFALLAHLAANNYSAIPNRVDLIDDSLLAMDALHQDDGWQWRAPEGDDFKRYVHDVLIALDQLEASPIPIKPLYHDAVEPTYVTFWKEGWDDITDDKTNALVTKTLQLSSGWTIAQQTDADELINELSHLKARAAQLERNTPLVMAHNDARQSNIAWHPDHGAKIVDWSWGDAAPKNADSTMFLIDLAKSGFDVSPYVEYINRDYVIVLIGFWLAHSLWETRDDSTTVREQQLASATAAHHLLKIMTVS